MVLFEWISGISNAMGSKAFSFGAMAIAHIARRLRLNQKKCYF